MQSTVREGDKPILLHVWLKKIGFLKVVKNNSILCSIFRVYREYNIFTIGYFNIFFFLRRLFLKPNSRKGKAFIVGGVEGSGTRMLARFFIYGGCYGHGGHKQVLDFNAPPRKTSLVMWRRSIPHGTLGYPSLEKMFSYLQRLGYETHIVEIRRSVKDTVTSQVRRNFSFNEQEALLKIKKGYQYLLYLKKKYGEGYVTVDYDRFLKSKGYRKTLSRLWGIHYQEKEEYTKKVRSNWEMGQ